MTRDRDPAANSDEDLDVAAQGSAPAQEDDDGLAESEIDVIGDAAGVTIPDGKPLGGTDAVERRDAHRWELDPRSAERTS